jgi:ketosteroid isomerase-like protein
VQVKDPADLGRLFAEQVSAGDIEGMVALYERDAKFVGPDGAEANGHEEIRARLEVLLAARPILASGQHRTIYAEISR